MSCSALGAGDAVEVLYGDGDATWRPARLVHPFISRPLFFVSFDDSPQRATVATDRIRPRPEQKSSEFELHQLVDARVAGAWRAGVVSKVHVAAGGASRYVICFPFAREEMEFGSHDVRPRLDWVDGNWLLAQKKDTTVPMYNSGSPVEIAHIIKKSLIGWYTATVVKVVDEKILLIEYVSLKTEIGTSQREIVASHYVRPCPSSNLGSKNFDLLDKVEACYSGGWWPGVISKVNAGSRYNVKFMCCEEIIEFCHTELRLLYDWVDGQWVQASQGKPKKSEPILASDDPANSVNQLTGFAAFANRSLCHLPTSYPCSGIDNTDKLSFESQLENLQPCKKAKKGETTEDNSRSLGLRGTGISKQAETSTAGKTGFDVRTPIMDEEPAFHIKSLAGKCPGVTSEKTTMVRTTLIGKPSSSISLNGPLISQKLGPESILSHTPVTNKAEELSKQKHHKDKFVQTAEWCQPRGVRSPSQQREGITPEHRCQIDKGPKQHTLGEKRRKNNRPRKLIIIDPSLEGDSMGNQRDNTMVSKPHNEELSTIKCGPCSGNGLEAQGLFNVMSGSSEASLVETSASGIQFSEAGSETQNELLVSTVDKQLAKSSVVEEAGYALKCRLDKSPQEQLVLPFEKCSFMWDSIESMEVFALMPQHPHFRPLEQYGKDFREGMAIGLMVTYSNMVKSIGKLQITDPPHKFDDILRTLVNLEAHGFDVQRLQVRLLDLLRMKQNEEQLIDEKSALEVMLTKERREREMMDAEIGSIEKATRELEQSLARLNEEKRHILQQRREGDSKLDKLEMDSRRIEEALLSTNHDFVAMVSIW